MACPDTNRLIDLLEGGEGELDLRAHVQECATCRAEFNLIREIPAAFRPALTVPDYLVGRVMMRLRGSSPGWTLRKRHVASAAGLGAITVAATIVGTGLADAGSPLGLLVFSATAGALAAAYEVRLARRDLAAEEGTPA
jgi:hypothetical protein